MKINWDKVRAKLLTWLDPGKEERDGFLKYVTIKNHSVSFDWAAYWTDHTDEFDRMVLGISKKNIDNIDS
jgi:hypothetical protein